MRVLRAIARIHEAVLYKGVPAVYLLFMYLLPFLERRDARWSPRLATGTLIVLLYDYVFASLVGFVAGAEAGGVVHGFAHALRRMRRRLFVYPLGVALCGLVFALTLVAWLAVGGAHAAAALRLALHRNLPLYSFQLKSLALEYAMLTTLWGMGELLFSMYAGGWSGRFGRESEEDFEPHEARDEPDVRQRAG
jgi:hypothetical protein